MIQIAGGQGGPLASHVIWLLLLEAGGAILLGIAAAWARFLGHVDRELLPG